MKGQLWRQGNGHPSSFSALVRSLVRGSCPRQHLQQSKKAIKPIEDEEERMVRPEKEIIYELGKAKGKTHGKQQARLYLVPSATSRH
jgi:hypothetical protein